MRVILLSIITRRRRSLSQPQPMCPACYRLAAVTAGMRAPIASRLVALLLTVAITAAVFVVYVSETSIYALWTDAESLKEDKLPPFPHSSVS